MDNNGSSTAMSDQKVKADRTRRIFERIATEAVRPGTPETSSFQRLSLEVLGMSDEALARLSDILDTPDETH